MRFTAVQEQPEIPKHEAFCEIHREMYCLGCNRHSCTARPGASGQSVLACARPALHRPALPCTPLHCALDMDSYCICRPPGGTMMASGRAYSAT